MKLACPRCANRTLEMQEDPNGVQALWCSTYYTAWNIEQAWKYDSSTSSVNSSKVNKKDII